PKSDYRCHAESRLPVGSGALSRLGVMTSPAKERIIQTKPFSIGQKWVNQDPIYGTFFGEVIEISDEGRRGTVVITDDQGNVLDTFSGSAATFQASGEWKLIEE